MPTSKRAERITVLSVVGTRPELIKMAPVIKLLARESDRVSSRVCLTGQHRDMLDPLLRFFDIHPDHDLNIMRPDQTLSDVLATAVQGLQSIIRADRPRWVVAQGDTTTVMAAAIAAFHERVPFAHVEAGLRSGDFARPFPEEFNRRVADLGAAWCFVPGVIARENLLREGVPEERVLITGNTVVDALLDAVARPSPLDSELERLVHSRKHMVLITAHRRESFGAPFRELCLAFRDLAHAYRDSLQLIYPVHLNPNVQAPVREILGGLENVALLSPLDYPSLVHVMKRAYFVLTDSGGIQEEAPSLHVPVLVMRDVTERPEAITRGMARLVGTDRATIVSAARALLDEPAARSRMASGENPYGDGHAGDRIVGALTGQSVTPFAAG